MTKPQQLPATSIVLLICVFIPGNFVAHPTDYPRGTPHGFQFSVEKRAA